MLYITKFQIHIADGTGSLGPLPLLFCQFDHCWVNELDTGFFGGLIVADLYALFCLNVLQTFLTSSNRTKTGTPLALDCEISTRTNKTQQCHRRKQADFKGNSSEQHHPNHGDCSQRWW